MRLPPKTTEKISPRLRRVEDFLAFWVPAKGIAPRRGLRAVFRQPQGFAPKPVHFIMKGIFIMTNDVSVFDHARIAELNDRFRKGTDPVAASLGGVFTTRGIQALDLLL
jgi:hypothetical protein